MVIKKRKARLVSVILSVMMVFAFMPLLGEEAYADDQLSGKCGENVNWALNEDTGVLTISGYGPMYDYYYEVDKRAPWSDKNYLIKKVVIKEGVTKVGDYAFYFGYLTSVELPDSVTVLGNSAFSQCTRLDSITLPGNLQVLGSSALFRCPLTELTIPRSVTEIGGYNFVNAKFTSFTFPGQVKVINERTFSGCDDLVNLVIEEGVTTIDREAFYGCEKLTGVSIPDSVTGIHDTAFNWYDGQQAYTNPIVTLYTEEGSYAEEYAYEKGIPVRTEGDISKASVGVADQVYTGEALKPLPVVVLDGVTLIKDVDYTVSYKNNTNAGDAVITLTGIGNYGVYTSKTFKIAPIKVKVPSGKTFTYNGKKRTGVAAGTDYTISGNTGTNAGTYKAVLSLKDKANHAWSDGKTADKTISWKINKAKNPLAVSGRTATVMYSKVKNAAQKLALYRVIKTTKKGKGTVTYTKSKGNGKITIAKKTGKVTVKKGIKKGTYTVKVKVRAAGTKNYKARTRTVTFKIKVN
ncbi:MAG: leucine-rich repeat domain-containing protein [Firmicutes bacterium]|nr:leucine-rich repeat domain-containing protein [Bacillota bacterium]